jgi:hypothetical protein
MLESGSLNESEFQILINEGDYKKLMEENK